MGRLLLLGGIALGYYLFTNAKQNQADGLTTDVADTGATCPDGYKLSEDGTACDLLDTAGLIENENPCPDKFKLSDDGTECVSTERDLNINTGSAIGDMAANMGISIATGGIISGAGWAIGRASAARSGAAQAAAIAAKAEAKAAAKAAQVAEQKAAQVAASKAAQVAEQKAAQIAASKAAQVAERKAAAVAVAKAEMLAAKAARSAVVAAKATRATALIGKALAGPGAVFSIIFTILAQSLVALLDLRPGSFESCASGEFDLSTLPNWAQAIIGGIPFAGDIFDLFSGVLCFHGGCGDGEENQNGLCYKKPLPGYKCESFLCYKQYAEFENNGMLHTFAHVTKKILMDTGQIPDTPPPGTVKSGLLYYKDPGPDYNVVAGVAWEKCKPGMTDTLTRCEDVYGNGIGRIP
jgi:hypothetical protein